MIQFESKYKLLFSLIFLFTAAQIQATDTQLIIRAKAKDAKFIGSSVGGAYVMVRNQLTGEILAQGLTSGSTGNTTVIMKEAKERYKSIADENTSKFLAKIDIDEPTFVQIEVKAPINKKQATVTATTELWLIPGKHILGDGVVIEIPGFIIDILKPRTHQFVSLKSLTDNSLTIEANMVMMCGCTISKGGLWNSEDIEVKGILKKNGEPFKEVTLSLSSNNLFSANVTLDSGGKYELTVYAYHPKSGNTGVDKVNYVVSE